MHKLENVSHFLQEDSPGSHDREIGAAGAVIKGARRAGAASHGPLHQKLEGCYPIIRYAMKADMNNAVTAQHLSVLEFWDQHELQAALGHSGQNRHTLYAWKKAYNEQGLAGLMP